jgi:hypothetical protein
MSLTGSHHSGDDLPVTIGQCTFLIGLVMLEKQRQGVQNVPGPIPVSTCSQHEESNLVLFADILSIILSDPDNTPDPVPEHALNLVKSEIIPYLRNRVLNFITRGKLSISQYLL